MRCRRGLADDPKRSRNIRGTYGVPIAGGAMKRRVVAIRGCIRRKNSARACLKGDEFHRRRRGLRARFP